MINGVNWVLIIVLTVIISLPFIISSIAIPICLAVHRKKGKKALPISDKKPKSKTKSK
ncbi:MAG: hypothetical protein LBG49_02715 [Mycoplasmataceae bacterium]|jgi:hypothetical protein|nr:hypothetical protein [Mycoplasmataceae bacterium]